LNEDLGEASEAASKTLFPALAERLNQSSALEPSPKAIQSSLLRVGSYI
jgi:hypothetical protein